MRMLHQVYQIITIPHFLDIQHVGHDPGELSCAKHERFTSWLSVRRDKKAWRLRCFASERMAENRGKREKMHVSLKHPVIYKEGRFEPNSFTAVSVAFRIFLS